MFFEEFSNTFTLVLYLLNQALSLLASIFLILKKQNPVKTLSWVLVMMLLPYFGLFCYLFLGRNFRKEKMFNWKGAADLKVRAGLAKGMISSFSEEDSKLPESLKDYTKMIFHNLRSGSSILTKDKSFKIFFTGREALEAMCSAIEEASEHIHLQSFILEDDEIGNKFKNLLITKAKEGLEVRLIYDGFGSRFLKRKFVKNLREAGVEVLIFSPFRWLFPPLIVNYRNHRKILVVDAKKAFLGGVNIADRYCDGGIYKQWRDTHMMLEGESVQSLQASFLLDRYFILNKNLKRRKKYFPEVDIENSLAMAESKTIYSQILSSGPDSDWAAIMQCYLLAISQAKKHIYIITPYFMPNDSLLDAVKIASLSNVEVSIMLPSRTDTWLAHWGTMSYVAELLSAGVKIYLFNDGFNHSKVLSVDREFCMIGSANMDIRSLEHHFEVTAVMYDKCAAEHIEDRFEKDIRLSTLITPAKWKKRPTKNKIYESIARLVSPML